MTTLLLIDLQADAWFSRMMNGDQFATVFHSIEDIQIAIEVSDSGTKVWMTDEVDSYFTRNIRQASHALATALA